MQKRRKIAFLIQGLTPYWNEALSALAQEWQDQGDLFVLSGGQYQSSLHPWAEGISSVSNSRQIFCPPLNRAGTAWPSEGMWEHLCEIEPDLIIIHEYAPYVILTGFLYAKSTGIPCLVTTDVGPVQRAGLSLAHQVLHAAVNATVDGVLAKTQDAMDQSRITKRSALFAPHAIATGLYEVGKARSEATRVPKRVVQIGSLIPRKGIDLLLAAFALVSKKRPDATLVLIGAGDQNWAEEQASAQGIRDKVVVKNFIQPTALIDEYAASDVFVLASRFDSYGVVVHEAAAAGLPLVVSKYAGASAVLVQHGRNGFQVDPFDAVGFAESICQCLESETNIKYGHASLQIAKENDVHTIAKRTISWLGSEWLNMPEAPRKSPNRLSGSLAFLRDLGRFFFGKFFATAPPDAFHSDHRDILFIMRHLPFYREGVLMQLAARWSLRVLYSGKSLGNLKTAERVESVVVPAFEAGKQKSDRHIFWLETSGEILRSRPAVVCTDLSLSLHSTWPLFLLRPLFDFRIVFWTHGLQNYGWKTQRLDLKDRIRLLWMRWADAVAFYSADRKADVEALAGKSPKYFVAQNMQNTSVFEREFHRLKDYGRERLRTELGVQGKTLLYIGRLSPEKEVLGLSTILALTAHLSAPPSLIVIGGGELEEKLRAACEEYGNRVRFLGPIFDETARAQWSYACDLVVCPGYAGLNIVDSLVMGTPFATVESRFLVKRHSPEISYVQAGRNAIFSKGIEALARDIGIWSETGEGLTADRNSIHKHFLRECSLENQYRGMMEAFNFVMSIK